MTFRRIVPVALAVAAVASAGGAQNPPPITEETVRAIDAWAQAVRAHTPGQEDAALKHVAALTYDDRVQLDAGMALFLDGLLGNRYNTGGSPAAKTLVEHGRASGAPDATGFLKRAAVLHAQAAPHPAPPDARARMPAGSGRVRGMADMGKRQRVSPLLATSPLPVTRDGELISRVQSTWHLPFARYLLDLVGTNEAPDPFVAAWYHATNAELFYRAAYGDMTSHLDHAARILPNHPLLLFDRGCYAEVLGLPVLQVLVPPPAAALVVGAPTGIPPASSTNAAAERLYRRALAVDPSLVEARVRLARLLIVRERYQEAEAVIAVAAADPPPGILGFYTHLFGGRVRQSLGRLDEAAAHYRAARQLFPSAQSALVAASQLALVRADVASALEPIAQLGGDSSDTADPWWQYDYCAGRDAEPLLQALWEGVAALR
jgi:hypothetical protein